MLHCRGPLWQRSAGWLKCVFCCFVAGGLCHQGGHQHGQPGSAVWGLDCLGVNAMLLHVFGPAKAWRSTRVQRVWGVGTAAPGHTGGRKWEADDESALPNSWALKMGQWPRSTAATTLPQPSATELTQCLVGLRPHLPFWGLIRQSSAEWGRGEGGQRPPYPRLGNTFPPHLHSSLSSCTH